MSAYPLRDKERRAQRAFYRRIALISLLMIGIAYAAWFAPWARPIRHVPVETIR
jgi:cell division septal protein FtsQ